MAIMAISMSAQNDVTTFLGIPVDGFKSEMKQKLVSKPVGGINLVHT